jgi:hypothetical protein
VAFERLKLLVEQSHVLELRRRHGVARGAQGKQTTISGVVARVQFSSAKVHK